MAYDQFATPSPTALYSEAFFSKLTFEQALHLSYPTIAPQNSVLSWSFSSELHSTGLSTLLLPNEAVPPLISIQPILQAMEQAFYEGMRSVQICHPSLQGVSVQHYHFSKVIIQKGLELNVEITMFLDTLIQDYQQPC